MSKPKKKPKPCSYCGKIAPDWEREHVIPRNMYPLFKRSSTVQRIVVPACPKCNDRWVNDEVEFRNVLVMAGEQPNGARQEIWTTVKRSFFKKDGSLRLSNVVAGMEPVLTDTGIRFKVYPAENPHVMTVVRKIVRGLCAYHKFSGPISDRQVRAAIFTGPKLDEVLAKMTHNPYESGVFEYWHVAFKDDPTHSIWFLRFFESVRFIAFVSRDAQGFPKEWRLPPGCTTGRKKK